MNLTGKKALVTGGSRGIGAAVARRLAAEGADVAITYEKAGAQAEAILGEIEAAGRKGAAIQANIADVAAAQDAVDRAAEALGGLDILVNNAGIFRFNDLADISIEDIQALLDVNVRGPIVTSKAALAHLSDGGSIITIGSYFADRVPIGGLGLYGASKSALTAFTRGLARELGGRGITVNVVQPGSTDTDMNPADGPFGDTMRQLTATGRYGAVDEIGHAVAYLASDQARYVTGTTLTVDGGANA